MNQRRDEGDRMESDRGRLVDAGDSCIVLALEARVDPAINQCCASIAREVSGHGLEGVRDVVAAYHSVAVHFDPLVGNRDGIANALREALVHARGDAFADGPGAVAERIHRVPVRYGREDGPDLHEVARQVGCAIDDVIRWHTAVTYRVFMMGFLPGFAYLGVLDPQIAVPRLATPRLRVPAGSVAIAGSQTGIYPVEAPGGWRIIGRTTLEPFDAARSEPLLFEVGDLVRFEADPGESPEAREAARAT